MIRIQPYAVGSNRAHIHARQTARGRKLVRNSRIEGSNAEEHTQHTCAHVVYVHSRPPAGRRRLFLLHHHLLPITRHAHASLYTHINITLTPYELIYPCINTCSDRWKHRRDIFDLTERSTVNYMAVGQTNLVSMLLSK